MDVQKLEQAIAEDKKNGYLPFAVMATIGTTATTSIDPVGEIAAICTRENIWLHVDGADLVEVGHDAGDETHHQRMRVCRFDGRQSA